VATTTTPATDPYADFKTAVKFTKLAHTDKYEAAKELVAPGSAADRYVIHQLKLQKAYQISGQDPGGEEPSIDSDKGKRSIRIEFTGEDGYSYTWKDFTFDHGKVTGWTGKSGLVASVLWSRASKDSALGTTARLVSAYRSNAGSMFVVVEFSTKRDVDLAYTASYAAKGGYRQNASDSSGEDLARERRR
jgi:hypothetical protein